MWVAAPRVALTPKVTWSLGFLELGLFEMFPTFSKSRSFAVAKSWHEFSPGGFNFSWVPSIEAIVSQLCSVHLWIAIGLK